MHCQQLKWLYLSYWQLDVRIWGKLSFFFFIGCVQTVIWNDCSLWFHRKPSCSHVFGWTEGQQLNMPERKHRVLYDSHFLRPGAKSSCLTSGSCSSKGDIVNEYVEEEGLNREEVHGLNRALWCAVHEDELSWIIFLLIRCHTCVWGYLVNISMQILNTQRSLLLNVTQHRFKLSVLKTELIVGEMCILSTSPPPQDRELQRLFNWYLIT